MSSKRALRRRSCEGKKQYADKVSAISATLKLRRFYNDPNLHHYRCEFGGHFHVGHYRKSRRRE